MKTFSKYLRNTTRFISFNKTPKISHLSNCFIKRESLIINGVNNIHDLNREINNSILPVILIFYADWCIHCDRMKKKIYQRFLALRTFRLVRINIDNNILIKNAFKIKCIPHVFLYINGVLIQDFYGDSEYDLTVMMRSVRISKRLYEKVKLVKLLKIINKI